MSPQRQRKKGALCSVLQCLNPPSTSRVSDRTGICKEDDDEEEDTSATWDQLLRSDEGDGREPGGGDGGGGGGGGGVTQGGEMSQLEQLIAPPSSYCSSSSSTSSSSSMLPAPSGERDAATAPGRGGGTGSATTFRDPVLTHVCGLTQQVRRGGVQCRALSLHDIWLGLCMWMMTCVHESIMRTLPFLPF